MIDHPGARAATALGTALLVAAATPLLAAAAAYTAAARAYTAAARARARRQGLVA